VGLAGSVPGGAPGAPARSVRAADAERVAVRVGSRPGGRNERNRRAVAEAVLAMLAEGRVELAAAEIADRSGVHRSTVYRRWPHRADLVREALTVHTRDLAVPDTGSWAGDVYALARELAAFCARPAEVAMNAVLATGADPELAALLRAHWEPLFVEFAVVVDRSVERGELASDVDPAAILNLLIAPLLVDTVLLRTPTSPERVRALADTLGRLGSAGR
jgi:AcrR family transcriptional regulator